MRARALLAAYDEQLRTDAETPSAIAVARAPRPGRLPRSSGRPEATRQDLMPSDSTEFSRPILERARLVKVSTTTPYMWRADGP